jgi:hypothetical protein
VASSSGPTGPLGGSVDGPATRSVRIAPPRGHRPRDDPLTRSFLVACPPGAQIAGAVGRGDGRRAERELCPLRRCRGQGRPSGRLGCLRGDGRLRCRTVLDRASRRRFPRRESRGRRRACGITQSRPRERRRSRARRSEGAGAGRRREAETQDGEAQTSPRRRRSDAHDGVHDWSNVRLNVPCGTMTRRGRLK